MNQLTEENIDFLYKDIGNRGITSSGLLDEMVDHICCTLESQLQQGIRFENAYEDFIQSLEDSTFKNLQHQDELFTNLKFQNMKKAMFISGFIGTLMLVTGVLFKIQHWAGAAAMMVFGMSLIVLLFLPIFFYVNYTEQTEKKNGMLHLIGFFVLAFLLIGPMFKVMHWPFTGILFFYGPLLLAAMFLPVYLVSVFRKSNETKTNFIFLLLLVAIGFSFLYSLSNTNFSKDVIEKYNANYIENKKAQYEFSIKNDTLIAQILAKDLRMEQKTQIENIGKQSLTIEHNMVVLIEKIKMASNDKKSLNLDLQAMGNKNVLEKLAESDYESFNKIASLVKEFRNSLNKLSKDHFQTQIINSYTDISIFEEEDKFNVLKNKTVIEILEELSKLQLNFQMAEYQVLSRY